jgi:hypothetical protein
MSGDAEVEMEAGPDRLLALVAFAGSFLVGAFLLFMVSGLVYSFFIL